MSILKPFPGTIEEYYRYQARQNYLREQSTIRGEYEEDLAHERAEKEKALREKEAALAEIERLKKETLAARAVTERLKALLTKKDS